MTVFGSPKQGDGTSRQDAIVDRASKKFLSLLNTVAPKVLNRPVGSKVLSGKAKIEDFRQTYYQQPDAQAKALTEYVSQLGWTRGLTDWSKWVSDSYAQIEGSDASN